MCKGAAEHIARVRTATFRLQRVEEGARGDRFLDRGNKQSAVLQFAIKSCAGEVQSSREAKLWKERRETKKKKKKKKKMKRKRKRKTDATAKKKKKK